MGYAAAVTCFDRRSPARWLVVLMVTLLPPGPSRSEPAQSDAMTGPSLETLNGPYDVTIVDSTGIEDHPRRPGLTSLGGGRLMLTYTRHNTRDVRIVRTADGVDWRSFDESIEDVPEEAVGLTCSRVTRAEGGLGIAWSYRVIPETERIRFTALSDEGRPISPSVPVDDGFVPPGASRQLGVPELAAGAGGSFVAVWSEVIYPDGEDPVIEQLRWSYSADRGATWSQPSGRIDVSSFVAGPFLTTSADATIYMATAHDEPVREIVLFRFVEDLLAWTELGRHPPEPGRTIGGTAAMAVAPDGTIGLVTTTTPDPVAPPTAVTFWRSTDGAASWDEAVEVSQEVTSGNHYDPKIASDVLGRWHAVWISAPPFSSTIDVYYSTSEDGHHWSNPRRVNPDPGTAAPEVPYSVSLATDDQGEVYIAYLYRRQPFWNPEAIHVMTTRDGPYDPLAGESPFTLDVSPNPFRVAARLDLASPGDGTADVRLYDAAGRLVRAWSEVALSRGVQTVEWDGRLQGGREAASGVYFWEAEIEADGERRRVTARSVRVR